MICTRLFPRFTRSLNRISYRRCSTQQKDEFKWAKRIFSGIQPTGSLHIGNYLGAVKKWVEFQNGGEDIMVSIVDLHSITLPQDPVKLRNNIYEITATLLACGIDPDKCVLFLQSSVPKHAELCWILGCFSTMARLSHLPQYKDKSETMKEIPLGLFVYPVLQAADILLYKATHVPVGEDQLQHLQMAQQIVKTFNHRCGKTFPYPAPIVGDDLSARVKSLKNPLKKMSKSDPDAMSRIQLIDDADTIRNKIKKAVTDSTRKVAYDLETRPGVSNLIGIHCMIADKIPEEVVEECEGITPGMYKKVVADALCEHLLPIRSKVEDYLKQPEMLTDILIRGATRANARANQTMIEVNEKLGIGIPNIL